MTGYQEILTDPSYHGQIVAMTYPLIGNYGVNAEDVESRRPWVRGFVVRELSRLVSNYRAAGSLDDYLAEHGDHRHRGDRHPGPGPPDPRARGDEGDPLDDRPRRRRLVAKAQASPGLVGRDLAREVMPDGPSTWEPGFDEPVRSDPTARPSAPLRRPRPPAARRGARLRHEVEHPPPPGRDRLPGHGRPRLDPGRGDPGARSPTGSSSPTAPATPAPLAEATATLQDPDPDRRRVARASRSSASAWATSSSARPSAPGPSSSSSATAARTTRSATSAPARSRSPPRTTASPSIPPRSPPTSSPATSTSTTRPSRACATRACPSSASSITPKPPPARTTASTSSPSSGR